MHDHPLLALASDELLARARPVKLLLFDVDGVLTDGRLYLDNHGEEYKAFNSRDGHGLKMLQRNGVDVGIITGRNSEIVAHRTRELGIRHVRQGCADKFAPRGGLQERIRRYNHALRSERETHWAFTILVVNAARDEDHRFNPRGEFSQSFAYAGGRFFVTTSERPPSAYAHETGHMFWAMDEYAGTASYYDRRGYYNTQNVNAYDQNPDLKSRQLSIMDRAGAGYSAKALSDSARQSIGWLDSDGDGLFDVLDVELKLTATAVSQPDDRTVTVTGQASAQALPHLNSSGTGNAITLNRVRRIEYRVDGGPWGFLGGVLLASLLVMARN